MPAQWSLQTEYLASAPHPLNRVDTLAARNITIGFLLVPNYTAIGYTCAIECLRSINMAARRPLFSALTITRDGMPVAASNGTQTVPDCAIEASPELDVLLVCGPNPIHYPHEKALKRWLWRLAGKDTELGGICTGSYLLAKAGLLDGYRCTIHWQDAERLRDRFPQLIISHNIFEVDRNRFTCSGGMASAHMMLYMLRERFHIDASIINTACDLLICESPRSPDDSQRLSVMRHSGLAHNKLLDALALMEANIEDTLSMREITQLVGISSRQLERLFDKYLASTPIAYYIQLRLARARQLLTSTNYPITDIAARCGFRSATYFSRQYKRLFGHAPSAVRQYGQASDKQEPNQTG